MELLEVFDATGSLPAAAELVDPGEARGRALGIGDDTGTQSHRERPQIAAIRNPFIVAFHVNTSFYARISAC